MIDIAELHMLCNSRAIKWTTHGLMRAQNRGINPSDVRNCIISGEIIEQYPTDYPYPSCLVVGKAVSDKSIHVVAAIGDGCLWIITAYFPAVEKWNEDLKTRREP